MPCKLKNIEIHNFKSFKDFKLSLRNFNTIVGRNGAGKTNLIEFFKFIKIALDDSVSIPYAPYLEWWSYKNIVWNGMTNLPISAKFDFEIDGHEVTYALSFVYEENNLKIKRERLSIHGIIDIEKDGLSLKVIHNPEQIDVHKDLLTSVVEDIKEHKFPIIREMQYEDFQEQIIAIKSEQWNILRLLPFMSFESGNRNGAKKVDRRSINKNDQTKNLELRFVLFFIEPGIKEGRSTFMCIDFDKSDILNKAISEIISFFKDLTILRHPNMEKIKSPSKMKREFLKEDGSNLTSTLFYNFISKGEVPERLVAGLRYIFPNMKISFGQTHNSEIFMKVFENNMEFEPPDISDGFYKFLLLLTAIDTETNFILIDEIENSMYADMLEYIISELKNSEKYVLITTHSPLIVDLVELEDILIAERTEDGTQIYGIKNPDELRSSLKELGITQSESWLYGDFE